MPPAPGNGKRRENDHDFERGTVGAVWRVSTLLVTAKNSAREPMSPIQTAGRMAACFRRRDNPTATIKAQQDKAVSGGQSLSDGLYRIATGEIERPRPHRVTAPDR